MRGASTAYAATEVVRAADRTRRRRWTATSRIVEVADLPAGDLRPGDLVRCLVVGSDGIDLIAAALEVLDGRTPTGQRVLVASAR